MKIRKRPMAIRRNEKRIYNLALSQVEETNKRLIALYEESQERIETELLKMQTKLIRGERISAFRQERLQGLYRAINEELAWLRQQTGRVITNGYVANYQNTYYLESFSIEQHVNTALKLDKDYILNFPELNRDAVIGSLNERIAGNTFGDRMLHDQRVLQFRVRQAVSQNIIEGQTVKQLAKNLGLIDEVFEQGAAKAMTTARTELLTAYSYGQEESVRNAIQAGVEFDYTWSASLTANTRETHMLADGQKAIIVNNEPIFTVGGVRFNSPRIVAASNESDDKAIKREKINCRCRRNNNPYGIKPTKRAAQRADGTWTDVNGDITAVEWAWREYGVNLKT